MTAIIRCPSRFQLVALVGVVAASTVLAISTLASAATGDGIDFNNKNTLVMFHTKDCAASGTWNYLDSSNDFSAGITKTGGPAWCRVLMRVMYKKTSTGKKYDTGWQWNASSVDWYDRGLRCYVQYAIQRPGDGNYVVTLTNRGAGGAGCGIDGY